MVATPQLRDLCRSSTPNSELLMVGRQCAKMLHRALPSGARAAAVPGCPRTPLPPHKAAQPCSWQSGCSGAWPPISPWFEESIFPLLLNWTWLQLYWLQGHWAGPLRGTGGQVSCWINATELWVEHMQAQAETSLGGVPENISGGWWVLPAGREEAGFGAVLSQNVLKSSTASCRCHWGLHRSRKA